MGGQECQMGLKIVKSATPLWLAIVGESPRLELALGQGCQLGIKGAKSATPFAWHPWHP